MVLSIASAPHGGAPNYRRLHCPSSHPPLPSTPDRRSACLGGKFECTLECWGGVYPSSPSFPIASRPSLGGVFLLGGPPYFRRAPAGLAVYSSPRLLSRFRWSWGATVTTIIGSHSVLAPERPWYYVCHMARKYMPWLLLIFLPILFTFFCFGVCLLLHGVVHLCISFILVSNHF